MKTKIISLALAFSMLLCALPISVSASGFLIGNPTVSGIRYSYYSQGMIAFGYGDPVSFGDDLTARFNDIASQYIVYVKALSGEPDETAASEPGTLLEDYSYYGNNPLYRNSLTIPAEVLEEYAGQYLKISIQAVESNGDYSWIVNTYYHLEAEAEYETNWDDDYNIDAEITKKLNQLRSMLVKTLFHSDLDTTLHMYDNYIDSAWSFGAASFWDTVANIDDLFKGDMQMSKAIRAVDMLLSNMDGGKAEEELSLVNSFISIFDGSLFANINNYDSETRIAVKALQTALSRVDADWASSQAMHGITAAMYQNLLQAIPSLDNSTIWTLLCLRDDSMAKFSDIGKLRRGLSRFSNLPDKFDSFSDKVQIAADLFTIFSDYTLQIERLNTIRACADPKNTQLYDAISERESFFEEALIRIGHVLKNASLDITLEAIEKANVIWAATSTAFKHIPVAASTSEAVMLTESFTELAQSSESYILDQIDFMIKTGQYGELSDLEDEIHMYADLRIVLNDLGKKLTLDSDTKDYLDDISNLINSIESGISSKLEEIHSLVNAK